MMESVSLVNKKHLYYLTKRLLSKCKTFKIKIEGNSMYPYLQDGEYVTVHCEDKNFHEGDLVLIDWGDSFVVHRLIDINEMRTKGDNLSCLDPSGIQVICVCTKDIGERSLLHYRWGKV